MNLNTLKNKEGKRWILLYIIHCAIFFAFLICLIILEPLWVEINLTVSGWIGFDFNVIFLVAILVLIPLSYGLALLLMNSNRIMKKNKINPHIIHRICPAILTILFIVLIASLLSLWGDLIKFIFQVLEFYYFFYMLVISFCLIFLMISFFQMIPQLKDNLSDKILNRNTKSILILICISATYIFVFASPLIFIPANVHYSDFPNKPALIAHRGASYLAPENTIISGEVAAEYDAVVGWEVDIRISLDGIPFLMHDDTLIRTTNVEEIFPNRKDNPASTFNISELLSLDAGSWFVDKDPYGTIAQGILNETDPEIFRGAKIPMFEEVLNFTRDNNFYLDFDIYKPSEDHPYYDLFFDILLDMTIESNIPLNKIMIHTRDQDFLEKIEEKTPGILLGWKGSPSKEEFQASEYEYDYINTGDGYNNDGYRSLYDENIPVMVYTIDSVERFYELWYLGATWVKTNSPHKFNDIEEPILAMNLGIYIAFWVVIYVIAINTVIVLLYKFKKEFGEGENKVLKIKD